MKSMTRILLIIFIFSSSFVKSISQNYITLDIVKVNAAYKEEAMYFYNENWKQFRIEAHKKGFISGFEMLKTETDSSKYFQLILITKYPDSLTFHNKEQNFAPIMKKS